MTNAEIEKALETPTDIKWAGEPLLGSIYGEEEIEACVAAIRDSMDITKGFGFSAQPIKDFEAEFAQYVGTKYAAAVNSCGPGLDLVMRYLHLQPGDEVIVPCINYVAAPLSVIGAGGTIVWAEVRESDLLLDPADVERKITPRTRAIYPVHIHGMSAPMDEYIAIAERHPHPVYGPPKVIGDAARAAGGEYKGTKIGKMGWATVFSFQTMKNMTTLGEGGMITTDDPDLNEYLHDVRMYGTWIGDWGTSNVMTKPQAAVGRVQLKKLDSFIAMRRRIAKARNEMLAGTPGVIISEDVECKEHSFYLYPVMLIPELGGEPRDRIMKRMREELGVATFIANPPVYDVHPVIKKVTTKRTPLAEAYAKRNICLPIQPAMSDHDNKYIAAAFIKCVNDEMAKL